jgi:hypothetical protein
VARWSERALALLLTNPASTTVYVCLIRSVSLTWNLSQSKTDSEKNFDFEQKHFEKQSEADGRGSDSLGGVIRWHNLLESRPGSELVELRHMRRRLWQRAEYTRPATACATSLEQSAT